MLDLWLPYACNLLRGRRSGAMWPNIAKDGYKAAGNRRRGQPYWHEPPPDPSFHRRCRSFDLLMRLHEKHSLPALRAFGQVRQHPLLFPRGGCTLNEHTELVSVGMYPGLEISVQTWPSLSGIVLPSDFCSNIRRLRSTSLGSVPSVSSAPRRRLARALRVRR